MSQVAPWNLRPLMSHAMGGISNLLGLVRMAFLNRFSSAIHYPTVSTRPHSLERKDTHENLTPTAYLPTPSLCAGVMWSRSSQGRLKKSFQKLTVEEFQAGLKKY